MRSETGTHTQLVHLAHSWRAVGGTHVAAARRCQLVALAGGDKSRERAARNASVLRSRDASPAAAMVLPHGAALLQPWLRAARKVTVPRAGDLPPPAPAMVLPRGDALQQPWPKRARAARSASVSRSHGALAAAPMVLPPPPAPLRGWGGAGESGTQRVRLYALATRRRRHPCPCGAAPPQPCLVGGARAERERHSTRPSLRASDAPPAAPMLLQHGTALPQPWLGGGGGGARAERELHATRPSLLFAARHRQHT
jgi:hypothetical protein